MPALTVIIGSTRPAPGFPSPQWFLDRARQHAGFEVEVADLSAIDLPLLNEPHHPRLRQYIHPHTKEWSARINRADALVIVTPEYNYGYPAPVKNAIAICTRNGGTSRSASSPTAESRPAPAPSSS